MAKWFLSRRTFLITAFIGLISELPGVAATSPVLKLFKTPTSTSAKFTITSPAAGTASTSSRNTKSSPGPPMNTPPYDAKS